MEKERKGFEILDEKISPENVMRMGKLFVYSYIIGEIESPPLGQDFAAFTRTSVKSIKTAQNAYLWGKSRISGKKKS